MIEEVNIVEGVDHSGISLRNLLDHDYLCTDNALGRILKRLKEQDKDESISPFGSYITDGKKLRE